MQIMRPFELLSKQFMALREILKFLLPKLEKLCVHSIFSSKRACSLCVRKSYRRTIPLLSPTNKQLGVSSKKRTPHIPTRSFVLGVDTVATEEICKARSALTSKICTTALDKPATMRVNPLYNIFI